MRFRTTFALLVAVTIVASVERLAAQAAVPPSLSATLRRIFASRELSPTERFGPAVWMDGGAAYTTLERSGGTANGVDIVRYETATGTRSVFVPASQLTPQGRTTPLDVEDYELSADGGRVLVFTNSERVWRQNTRGDYWVLDRKAGSLRQLGGAGAAPASLMYAKFSPDGSRVAYVREGEIYVEPVAGGSPVRLTSGADSLHVNGMTDWVYEEEFGLQDGFRWSPDGRRIAYWQFDMTGVGTFRLINDTDSLYPIVIPIQYPKVGTTNSAVRAGVVSAVGGPTTWLQLPDDLRENYLPRLEWAGPDELVFQRIGRLQQVDRVMLADAGSGRTRTVLTERDSAWVDVVNDVTWLGGGEEFLWVSERDGWRHVYRVARDGSRVTRVTTGDYDVVSVEAVDERGGWLYYIASPDRPTERYLYRTRLDGRGRPARVSPADAPGTHGYTISPDATWAFHTYSRFDLPPSADLVRLPTHERIRLLADNAVQAAAVRAAGVRAPEFFRVAVGGGVELDGWMVKPADFDSTRVYPMLFYVYGEPASQTVRNAWTGARGIWYRALADAGYIVVSVDNRGTPAPRGRAWRKVVYQQIGVLSSAEQAAAVKELVRTRPYLDPDRVAIWGWSGGGSSTLQAMFRYPDVYQVGMAVAPVPDQLLYDTIYQERYMGLPSLDPEAFARASPVNVADGLRGRLLVVHGSGDDNVHYQGTERLVNRLVSLGKSFDLMVYPNRSHRICEGQGTTLHVYDLLTRYLSEHLPAGGRVRATP